MPNIDDRQQGLVSEHELISSPQVPLIAPLHFSLSSAEESDRMLEADPRIVLRPIGHVEEA